MFGKCLVDSGKTCSIAKVYRFLFSAPLRIALITVYFQSHRIVFAENDPDVGQLWKLPLLMGMGILFFLQNIFDFIMEDLPKVAIRNVAILIIFFFE